VGNVAKQWGAVNKRLAYAYMNKIDIEKYIEELISLLKQHDAQSHHVKELLNKVRGIEYFEEMQSVLDIKELLDVGLLGHKLD
jgi:hypothetical protein